MNIQFNKLFTVPIVNTERILTDYRWQQCVQERQGGCSQDLQSLKKEHAHNVINCCEK